MQFATRARVERTDIYIRRIWMSRDGCYRVSEFKRTDGTTVYYAERFGMCPIGPVWDVISRHRKKSTAIAACDRHHKS